MKNTLAIPLVALLLMPAATLQAQDARNTILTSRTHYAMPSFASR